MNHVGEHIRKILLDYNSLTIYGIGGFFIEYIPSKYNEDLSLYIPAYRSVVFNPQLVYKDDLLIKSYMEAYDLSFAKAENLMIKDLKIFKAELEENGVFEILGVGTLYASAGKYTFKSCESGLLSPKLFSYECFEMNILNFHGQRPLLVNYSQNKLSRNKDHYIFSINKEFVNYIFAAIIVSFFYFLFATPIWQDSRLNKVCQAAIFSQPDNYDLNVINIATRKEKCKKIFSNTNSHSTSVIKVNVKKRTSHSFFTIILASSVSKKNALLFIKHLERRGILGAKFYCSKPINRIIIGKFLSRESAQKELEFLYKYKELRSSWILEIRDK